MDDSLIGLVERLARPRVLVIGDLMLDRYVWGNAERISPEAPIPVLRVSRCEQRLGGAAGVAGILRVLEAEVIVAGVLGNDAAGNQCKQMLDERGIASSLLHIDSTHQTTVKERYIGCAEQKHPQQVLRVDYESDEPIADGLLQAFADGLRKQIRLHDIVLVSDYGKGVCRPALVQSLIAECRAAGIRLLADPGRKRGDLQGFRGANALTPNRREAGIVTGLSLTDIETAGAAAERLRDMLQLEVGLVTLDRDGMILADQNGRQHFPARAREVYDITGAGDVTLATLGLVLASGHGYADAIRIANVAAGLSVEGIGVTAVSRGEIIADLMRHAPPRKEKLLARDALVRELDRHRQLGRTIVFTNGCFDLLHSGHIYTLREARSRGDLLVVGLNSDASVRRLGKGDGRPINDHFARARVLSALECVDYVCIFEEETPADLIRAVRPRFLVKGADYRPEQVAGRDFVESYGGQLILLPLQPEQSTTGTIERIKKA